VAWTQNPVKHFFAPGSMLVCAAHIIGRNSSGRHACVWVRMRVRVCVCACACVCACGGCRVLDGTIRRPAPGPGEGGPRTHNSLLFTPHPTQLYPHTPSDGTIHRHHPLLRYLIFQKTS